MTISIVISAFNEEKKIARLLESVKWADEIIVIDNQSSDKTGVIAEKHGAIVYQRANNTMLNINKNYGFEKATKDWILNLDGDEEVPDVLAKEIKNVILQDNDIYGYWIPRKNIIFGKWIQHGLWWPDKQLRLFRRGKGRFPCEHVHEYITIDGKTSEVTEPYIHYNYETISQFLRKLDTIYTENEVENLLKKGNTFQWQDALRKPVSDFVKVYFAQSGYKDGLHGLILAMLQAFYAFVVIAKLWEKNGFNDQLVSIKEIKKELKNAKNEVEYWEETVHLQEEKQYLKKILIKLKRKYVTSR